MPEKNMRFTPTNIADYLIYKYPYLYVIECKSTGNRAIGIQRTPEDPKAMIMAHQIQDLINADKEVGIHSILVLNYRNDDDINENITYALPIEGFVKFLADTNKKSINKLDCVQYGAIVVQQKLKRTHYGYDIEGMMDDIVEKRKEF